ncbi:hypothetical protein [Clostridium sp. E02]|uniref:hypothetical protein n=1 Tax=Clostridium sp. E02 TaxID=2487134 RepID=UPI000F542D95|nr:hypothetical protein [Clostridium sp. E02]
MTIGRMSIVRNADRYFTIALDEYNDNKMRGLIFHNQNMAGVAFESFFELMLYMDGVFHEMGYPKQTVQVRNFPDTDTLDKSAKVSNETERQGKLATFRLFVQYCYHASWQGAIIWEGNEKREQFDSELQLIQILDQKLCGKRIITQKQQFINTCHVAIESYERGEITGNYQNIPAEVVEKYNEPVDFAKTLSDFIKFSGYENESLKYGLNYGQMISSDACNLCRKGGKLGSFSIKILFCEHNTCQGIIFWREGRQQVAFRSFKEMFSMIASAVESSKDNHSKTISHRTHTSLIASGSK